jgi:hypothetical protein
MFGVVWRCVCCVCRIDASSPAESLLAQFVSDEKLTFPIAIAATDMAGAPYEKFIGKYKGVPAIVSVLRVCVVARGAD